MPLSFSTAIKRISDHYDAEICMYIGPIDRPFDDEFIARCMAFLSEPNRTVHRNFLLLLTTFGGDPHAAYRMARFIQERFKTVAEGETYPSANPGASAKFYIYIDTFCKSAGTIMALGADTLIMSDYGELGPIDVQLRKTDEVGERSSGLTPMDALSAMNDLATEHFSDLFKHLRGGKDRELVFSTKMASEIAAKITVGLFGNIYSQIDPMRLGEYDRATRIALEYGNRLSHNNLHPGKLRHLLSDYPAHAFVIDRKEAKEIFASVEEPVPELAEFGERARSIWNPRHLGADEPFILYLTTEDFLRDAEPDATQDPNAPVDSVPELQPNEDNHEPPPPHEDGQHPAR
jgi:hypothetical protein